MADLNSPTVRQRLSADENPDSAPSGEPIWDIIELLFFAYRDFVSDPDEVLGKLGFGRAHHRVLHFVNRNPAIKVANLLDILKITKQSLGRVLKQLIDEEGNPELKLRVFVSGGGCSGFQYGFTFDEAVSEDDTAMQKNGVTLLIDPMSYQDLVGAEIDYRNGYYFATAPGRLRGGPGSRPRQKRSARGGIS